MIKTKYTIHDRLDEIEKEVKALRFDLEQKHMRPGPQGDSIRGEKGDTVVGPAGRDGKNGVDAVGLPGTNGVNGRNGIDGLPGPDTIAVLAEARSEIATIRSQFASLKQDFETLSLAFTTSSKKNAEYIEFLRAKREKRLEEWKKQA